MAVLITFIFGVLLIALPIVLNVLGIDIGIAGQIVVTGAGGTMVLFSGIAFVFTRLYQKTKASEAFVRTGQGGARVIQDGGAVIIPFIHELIRVSLRTLKLEVARENEDALITSDKLRADVRAEFFVRVNPEADAILQAARSLGERMARPDEVRALVEDKLVSALRTAAAKQTLEQLNSERDTFLDEVEKLVAQDLQNNGLILETVTISSLDQTSSEFLKDDNIFDAQGSRKIAEITEKNLTARNELIRAGEEARKEQDVEQRKRILALDRDEKEATARQAAEVQKIQAEADRDASTKTILMNQETQLAGIAKQKALEIAEAERQQQVQVAQEQQAQAVALAQETKNQAVALAAEKREQAQKVAEQQKQAAVATAEAQKAEEQRVLEEKLAEVETAKQKVETITVVETAERERQKAVTNATAAAEQAFVTEQKRADATAYATEKEATARKTAAEANATAIRLRAEAEAEASRQEADGQKAKAMVPVEVNRAQVEVDRDRVNTVVKPELEAREKHGKVAQDFEIAKLQVEAERSVKIAIANAQATMFQRVEAKLYGTPDQVNEMIGSFTQGQGFATKIDGFLENLDPTTKEAVTGMVRQLAALASNSKTKTEVTEETFGETVKVEPEADSANA